MLVLAELERMDDQPIEDPVSNTLLGAGYRLRSRRRGGWCRLFFLRWWVSRASRCDRPARLMKEGQAPSQHSPQREDFQSALRFRLNGPVNGQRATVRWDRKSIGVR